MFQPPPHSTKWILPPLYEIIIYPSFYIAVYLTLAMLRVPSDPLTSASPVSPTLHMPTASPFYRSKDGSIAVSFPTWLRVTTLSTVISPCHWTLSFHFQTAHHLVDRHSLESNVPITRTDARKYFFAARVVKIWNALPVNCVHAPSTHSS